MQDLIDELLDNALANGHDWSEAPASEVANDLVRFSADVENERPQDLVPFIENWQRRQKSSEIE